MGEPPSLTHILYTTLMTFVISDESLNSYGFRLLSGGCDLSAFLRNPVMFYNHLGYDRPPIGRWENVRIEGDKILGDPVFDMSDPFAAEIARKVEEHYISAASVGAEIIESSSLDMVEGQTEPTVTRWRLFEVSIVNLPANADAVAIYNDRGSRLKGEEVLRAVRLSAGNPDLITPTTNDMNKELITLLSLPDTADDKDVTEVVAGMQEELTTLRREKEEREAADKARLRKHFEEVLSSAITSGAVSKAQEEIYKSLYLKASEETITALEAMPRPRSVASAVESAVTTSRDKSLASLSWDELDRSGRLAELRSTDPDAYAEKYKAKFGTND